MATTESFLSDGSHSHFRTLLEDGGTKDEDHLTKIKKVVDHENPKDPLLAKFLVVAALTAAGLGHLLTLQWLMEHLRPLFVRAKRRKRVTPYCLLPYYKVV